MKPAVHALHRTDDSPPAGHAVHELTVDDLTVSRGGRTVVQAVDPAWVTLHEGFLPCVANDI